MKVKNNYNECLTNLACSIRKYFGLDYEHNTLTYIDKVLESEEYSYLPDEAKEYVKDAFEATGKVIPTEKNKKDNQAYLNPSYINYLQLSSAERNNVSDIPDPYTIDYNYRKATHPLISLKYVKSFANACQKCFYYQYFRLKVCPRWDAKY